MPALMSLCTGFLIRKFFQKSLVAGWRRLGRLFAFNRVTRRKRFAIALESQPGIHLNLTPSTDSCEYAPDVASKNSVSIPAQSERTLRVAWDGKVRMIQQVVGFRAEGNLFAFRQSESLLQPEIPLRESGAAQDITSSVTKLTASGYCKSIRTKPA